MIRFTHLFFWLLLLIAVPLLAQSKAPPAPQSDQVAQIKAQDAKIEALTKSVAEARYEKNIAEIKAEVLQSQTSWFEILVGFFGILITVAVIFITLRSEKLAVAEAKVAAIDALEAKRGDIQVLLDQAKAAVADIHVERETARQLTKGLRAGEAPTDPETQGKIADLAEEAKKKPRKERSLDDYRALVLDAFIQKDWAAMERRAWAMAYWFKDEADDESMAFALFHKAFALSSAEKAEDAIAAYDEVMAAYGDNHSPALQEHLAWTIYNKGVDLGTLKRSEDAIVAYDEVVARFGDTDNPALLELVANALYNKGIRLDTLDRSEDAIKVYDEVVERFGDTDNLALLERVAKALYNMGGRLNALNRSEDAIAAYDEVISRFGDTDNPALLERVAESLFNKGCALAVLGNTKACIDALTRLGAQRGALDCEKIKADADFDKIRSRKAFKAFLAAHGCV